MQRICFTELKERCVSLKAAGSYDHHQLKTSAEDRRVPLIFPELGKRSHIIDVGKGRTLSGVNDVLFTPFALIHKWAPSLRKQSARRKNVKTSQDHAAVAVTAPRSDRVFKTRTWLSDPNSISEERSSRYIRNISNLVRELAFQFPSCKSCTIWGVLEIKGFSENDIITEVRFYYFSRYHLMGTLASLLLKQYLAGDAFVMIQMERNFCSSFPPSELLAHIHELMKLRFTESVH